MQDLERLKQAVMFTGEDTQAPRMAGQVLADQIDAVLDVWYRFMQQAAPDPPCPARAAPFSRR